MLEPDRTEFFGTGERYFHVKKFELDKPVYLVAEVSDQLILRLARDGIIEFLVICSLLVCVIVCLVAWVLSRKLILPLNRLVDIVSEERSGELPVGFSQGDKSHSGRESYVFPSNEIGLLAHTLDASFEQINQAIAREKAFTRDVSHELRTPLAIIKNAVELQLRRLEPDNDSFSKVEKASAKEKVDSDAKTSQIKSDAAKQMSILNRIGNAAIEMEKTVQTLLLLAREEHTQSVKTQTELMPIIENVVIQHRHLLDDKEIEVVIDDSCNTKQMVNKDMLTVLLNNLFLNAIQHTECGQIRFCVKDGAIWVSDNGSGIDPELLQYITDPSVKGKHSQGFGFGMAIVKRLCEHQDWGLEITNGAMDSAQGTAATGATIKVAF